MTEMLQYFFGADKDMSVIYQSLADELVKCEHVNKALQQQGLIELHKASCLVPDSPTIYAIGKLYVILISPVRFPNIAADEACAIRLVKAAPSSLSAMTLDIIAEGHLDDGRSFLVLPRGIPASRNRFRFAIGKRNLTRVILRWLRDLAREARAPSDETSTEFRASLESLATLNDLPKQILNTTHLGLARLATGRFLPRHCAMHGDLWKGNIIYGPDRSPRLIDWRGCRLDGFGIFDLLKFTQSFKLDARTVRYEIDEHSRSLRIDMADVKSTFLACCGSIYRNLDQFPRESFLEMTTSLYEFLEASMPVSPARTRRFFRGWHS